MSDALQLSRCADAIEPTMIRSLRADMRPSTIDFGLGQPDLEVGTAVRETIQQQLDGPTFASYTPNAGSAEARRAVADHAGVEPRQVMLTCGVQQALAVAILGLCDPGDEVLVPDPGFPAYDNLVRAAGATPVRYRLRAPRPDRPGWSLNPGAVAEALSDNTRLAVLNNPSNPTGAVFPPEKLEQIVELLADHGVGWISDEIYRDYVWEGQFASARRFDPTGGVVLSGLSKSHHLMGWRIGWMTGPAEVIDALIPLHQHLVTCAPSPAQRATIAALGDHGDAVASTRAVFRRRRRRLLDGLDRLQPGSPPQIDGTFYLFLDVRPWLGAFESTLELTRALLDEQDVMVVPGEGFGPGGLGHLRVAFTIGADRLEQGVQRIVDFLRQHR